MSYLTLPNNTIADFPKAVISLWFRIPKVSIDAAAKDHDKAFATGDPDNPFGYGIGWGAHVFSAFAKQPPQMAGIIPLVTFGKKGKSSLTEYIEKTFGHYTSTDYYYYQEPPNSGPDDPFEWRVLGEIENNLRFVVPEGPKTSWDMESSYIGVWCTAAPRRALLAVNLSMDGHATITGLGSVTSMTHSDEEFYPRPWSLDPTGTGYPPAPRTVITDITVNKDIQPSDVLPETESLRTHPKIKDLAQNDGTGISKPFGITVEPDQWHHLLLSFDLTTSCKTHGILYRAESDPFPPALETPTKWVDSAPKMWIAYDDENKKGRDLSYYWVGKGASHSKDNPPAADHADDENADPNEVMTPQGWRLAGTPTADNSRATFDDGRGHDITITVSGLSTPKYDFSEMKLPTKDEPIGLPASAEWVDHVYRVEMAEFQMFAGVALDTSVITNRHAFIDKDGKPVPPDQKQLTDSTGAVVKDAGSIELLARRPEILLHGSSNWKQGNNTGSIGAKIEEDGTTTKLNNGQFTPVAGIEPYKPDPSIEKETA